MSRRAKLDLVTQILCLIGFVATEVFLVLAMVTQEISPWLGAAAIGAIVLAFSRSRGTG